MRDLFSEDWHIVIEVKRTNGELWVKASIDGVEAQTVEVSKALVSRVLFGLINFATKGDPNEGD